jgi:large subunit ribosomal protein L28
MGYVCHFTGKKVGRGMKRVWRGQAISKGGFGLKPTGITPRLFKPNLQTVAALITEPDGTRRVKRVRASAKAIRTGLVVKALKRKYGYTRQKKQAAV